VRRSALIIRVVLPVNRRETGNLEVFDSDGGVGWGPAEVLGLTEHGFASDHGNPTRSTLYPFGDIPLGWYRARLSVPPHLPYLKPTRTLRHEYGSSGWLTLEPINGDALLARNRGAYGFAIVGGEMNHERKLRPTLCGLRLAEWDMSALRAEIENRALGTSEILVLIVEPDYPADRFAAELADFNRFL
jgi:hypothetical protein